MGGYIDNAVEFLKDEKTATVTFSQGRYVSRIRELSKRFPDDVEIITDADGVLCAHIPTKWLRINPERQVSDDYREKMKNKAIQSGLGKSIGNGLR